MMCLMLSEHGFTGDAVSTGAGGIASAQTTLPDIALVDIDLPDMSGYEIAARLRKAPRTAGIRLVAMTGYRQASDREKTLPAGFDKHFAKPAPIEALIEIINQLVKQAVV